MFNKKLKQRVLELENSMDLLRYIIKEKHPEMNDRFTILESKIIDLENKLFSFRDKYNRSFMRSLIKNVLNENETKS